MFLIFSVELFPGADKQDTSFSVYCDDISIQTEIFNTVDSFIVKNEKFTIYFSNMLCPDEHFIINLMKFFKLPFINHQICFCNKKNT